MQVDHGNYALHPYRQTTKTFKSVDVEVTIRSNHGICRLRRGANSVLNTSSNSDIEKVTMSLRHVLLQCADEKHVYIYPGYSHTKELVFFIQFLTCGSVTYVYSGSRPLWCSFIDTRHTVDRLDSLFIDVYLAGRWAVITQFWMRYADC